MIRYVLQERDTLQDIAQRHGTTAEAIVEANRLDFPFITDDPAFVSERAASGTVRVSVAEALDHDVVFPQGSRAFSPTGSPDVVREYLTSEAATLRAGSLFVDIPIVCTVPGPFGNVATDRILRLVTNSLEVPGDFGLSLSNPAITNGISLRIRRPGDVLVIPAEGDIVDEGDVYGTDIAMGEENDIEIDGFGDLAVVSGLSNVASAVQQRLMTAIGSLPQTPLYGSNLPVLIGRRNVPHWRQMVELEIVMAAKGDPRIDDVRNISIVAEGDAVFVSADIVVAGEPQEIAFSMGVSRVLEIKPFNRIVADAIDYVRSRSKSLSDFSVGSRIRVLIEAISRQVHELYIAVHQGQKAAIQTAVYDSFDFPIRPAIPATGYVTFYTSEPAVEDISVPRGTIVARTASDGQDVAYVTTETVIIPVGKTEVDAFVTAQSAGILGNCPRDSITKLITTPPGIVGVNNQQALTNGKEVETPEERKNRFRLFLDSLPRGTNDALAYAASTVEGVEDVSVADAQPIYFSREEGGVAEPPMPLAMLDDIFMFLDKTDGNFAYFGSVRKLPKLVIDAVDLDDVVSDLKWEIWTASGWAEVTVEIASFFGIVTVRLDEHGDTDDWIPNKLGNQIMFWVRARVPVGGISKIPAFVGGGGSARGDIPMAWAVVAVRHSTVGDDILHRVAAVVDKYRAAGIQVNIVDGKGITVALTIQISVAPGLDEQAVAEEIRQVVHDRAVGSKMGQPLRIRDVSTILQRYEDNGTLLSYSIPVGSDRYLFFDEYVEDTTISVIVE